MQNVGAQTNSGRNRIGAIRLRVNHAPVPHSNNTIRTRHVGLGCVFTDFRSNRNYIRDPNDFGSFKLN